jgi:O-antigen/teichoic acid export membrane protein
MAHNKRRPMNALLWSGGSAVISAVIDIFKLAIITYYLAPNELGVYALLTVVLGFSQLFSEGGLANAVISRETLERSTLGQLFNLNICLAVVVMLVGMLLAPFVAMFYETDELRLLIPLILIGLPISAVNRFYQAVLQQHLMMQWIGLTIIVAKCLGLVATILLCWLGLGLYALIAASLITTVALCALLISKASSSITYQRRINWTAVKPFVSFSMYQLGDQLLNFFSKNFDVLLITKLLGTEASGLYHVCKSLLMRAGEVIVSSFTRYFHPLLANLRVFEPSEFEEAYLKLFRSITLATVTVYTMLAINHQWLIALVFGPKFQMIDSLFVAMCLWLSLRFSTAPIATLWLVNQKPEIGLYWNGFIAAILPVIIFMGHSQGNLGIVNALALTQLALLSFAISLSGLLQRHFWNAVKPQLIWLSIMIIGAVTILSATTQFQSVASTISSSILIIFAISVFVYRLKDRYFLV